MTMKKSATEPLVVYHLWPLMTYSSPSRTRPWSRAGWGPSRPSRARSWRSRCAARPSSSGSSHRSRWSSAPGRLDADGQQLGVARVGRVVAEDHRAVGGLARGSRASGPACTWPKPMPPELGGRCAAHSPSRLDLLLERGDDREHLVVGRGRGSRAGRPPRARRPRIQASLRLELRLGLEVPGHDAPPSRGRRCRRHRCRTPSPGALPWAPCPASLTSPPRVAPSPSGRPARPRRPRPGRRSARPSAPLLAEPQSGPCSTSAACSAADELAALAALPDGAVMALAALAHQVRLAWCGPEVEVEGILSAKTGGCPEDCHFCSQSSRFDTPVKATPVPRHRRGAGGGAGRPRRSAPPSSASCWPCAAPTSAPCARILELVPLVRDETGLNVAVSAGILTDDQARRLAEGGVHRYNHNLETARSFFPEVVTTHTWEERAGDLPAGAGTTAWSCAAGRSSAWARPTPSGSSCCSSCAGARPHRGARQLPEPPSGHPAGRPAGRRRLGGHPLDRPVPPRPARRSSSATPAAARSPCATSRPWA